MKCIFSWVHISDCHFGHGSARYGHDQALVLDRLRADISSEVRDGTVPTPQAVLVSGDIGNSGAALQADEYELAYEWFAGLVELLQLDVTNVFTVPGNHDIDRSVAGENRETFRLIDGLRRGAPIDDALQDETERARLSEQLLGYRAFVERLGTPCLGTDGMAIHWVQGHQTADGYTIRLSGLNTVLLATGEDAKRLQVGLEQIRGAFLPAPDESTVTIAISHHPFEWLQDEDGAAAEAWTSEHADVHLLGHVHSQSTASSRIGGGPEIVEIVAGAAHGDEDGQPVHSYNFGAVYVDDDGSLVTRVWHRRWSKTGFVRDVDRADDKSAGFAEFRSRRKVKARDASGPEDATTTASRLMLQSVGARRTAYPTDLTIAELDARGVLILPRLLAYADGAEAFRMESLAETLVTRGSVLVLGDPGAGKTVLVYLLHQELLKRGHQPLSLSIADFADLDNITTSDLEAAVRKRLPEGTAVDFESDRLVFLVDGIDEAIAAGLSVEALGRIIDQLPRLGVVLAACRTREFEDQLVGRVNVEQFARIFVLDEWALSDFEAFVAALQAAQLLDDDSVVGLVRGSSALQQLTRRPLYARMLTFVYPSEPSEIDDVASLYSAYLRHLARTVDYRLARVGCEEGNVYRLWQSIAWYLYSNQLFHQELIPAALPGAHLVRDHGLSPSCAQTVVHGLLDFVQTGADLRARFRHYSFFEYLVADYVATALVERAMGGEQTAWDLLSRDLSREIRRHLTRILNASAPQLVVRLLLGQFPRLGEDVEDVTARRVAGNLIAYILGRTGATARQLRVLLDAEQDDFLRTSMFWALANVDDLQTSSRYLDLLREDKNMASLNRGYLLYYWGDLRADQEPPYRDDSPDAEWSHTRSRTMDLMRAPDYPAREGASRRALDLMTFLDFITHHGDTLGPDEVALISTRLAELEGAEELMTPVRELFVGASRQS